MEEKGFTLIELLAVIVILAIIALIATPIVLNIISDTKDSARLRSAEFYLDAVEMSIAKSKLDSINIESNKYQIMKDGNICLKTYDSINEACTDEDSIDNNEILKVEINGEVPNAGSTVTIENGKVKDVLLKYNTNTIVKENEKLVYDDSNEKEEENIPEPTPFAEDSWDTIAANVKAGNLSAYKVGDTKEVTLTGYTNEEKDENGNNTVTYTVRIANLPSKTDEEEEKCGTDGFSETACGFVVEFVDIITTHKMNDTATNAGGWKDSLMRKFVTPVKDENGNVIEGTGTIYNALPEDLKNNIIETKVVSGYESGKTTNYETQDKLYLLSTKELYGAAHTSDKVVNETRQLDYYQQQGVTTESSKRAPAIKKYNGTATTYWLRSASSNATYTFFIVSTTGVWSNYIASNANGVAVAFRIG